jgi:hypothetical protein
MELFERFEVNRDPRWQVIIKLLVASLVLHLVFVWAVIYIPVFRDTLNIASLIANTKFVEKDYEATQIRDDVQLVQISDKFHYPEGYFAFEQQLATGQIPGQTAAADPFAPKIISQWSKESKVYPEALASPSPAASASPAASPSASPSASAIAQASPSASPLTPEQAQKELEKTAEQNDVTLPDENEINKKVLKDFATYANDLKNEGKLNFEQPFEIVITAKLDEKGKLKNWEFQKKAGDETLVAVFSRLVTALNDSGFLSYLQPISKDNPDATVVITVKQGEKDVLASVVSEASSPERAESLAKALNNLLYFGAGSRAGHDEEVLMKNTNAAPDGKRVVINFSMPRQSVVDMIKKNLEPGV